MVDWTTVVISVGSSIATSIGGLYLSSKQEESREKHSLKEDWYRKVMSQSTQLRDESLNIPYGTEIDIDTLQSPEDARRDATLEPSKKIIDDLQKSRANAPGGADQTVKSAISDVVVYFDNIEAESGSLPTNEIRQELEERSESIRREVTKSSDRYEDGLN